MNKYNRRVNGLYEKTHCFISFENLCRIKDFYRCKINEFGCEPEDFLSEIDALDSQADTASKTNLSDGSAVYKRLFVDNPAVYYARMYFFSVERCEENPNGQWLHETFGKGLFQTAKMAKKYFEDEINNSVTTQRIF